jgi:hypothetical protein
MANSNEVANILINNLNINIKNLENDLNDFLIEPYPYEEIKTLIKQLIAIINEFYKEIDKIQKKLSEKGSSEDIDETIILYTGLLEYIHSLFGLIKMAQQYNIPNSIVYLVDSITEKLQKNTIIIVVPSYTHNFYYSELRSQLKNKFINIITETTVIFKDEDKKFALLIYPFIYNNNISKSTLLAHEIGHHIETEKKIIDKLITNIHFDPKEIENIAKNELEKTKDKGTLERYFDLDTMKAVVQNRTQEMIKNWLEELYCDIIGLKIIGPMYLLINTEFLLSSGKSTTLYAQHPSIEMRLKNLFNIYENSQFNKKSDNKNLINYNIILNNIKIYINNIKISLDENPIVKLAYYKTNSILPSLQAEVDDTIKDLLTDYKPDIYFEEVPKLVSKMESLIIPCEISQGKPANIISILNSANIFMMTTMNNTYQQHKDEININYLNFQYQIDQLVARSIELSIIHQKFIKYGVNTYEC